MIKPTTRTERFRLFHQWLDLGHLYTARSGIVLGMDEDGRIGMYLVVTNRQGKEIEGIACTEDVTFNYVCKCVDEITPELWEQIEREVERELS